MQSNGNARRAWGNGSLIVRRDSRGRGTWYAKWRDAQGRQVMRKIGPKREYGGKVGLSKTEANAELRRMVAEAAAAPTIAERLTLDVAGDRYLRHLENVMQRKATTVQDYRIMLDRHLAPFFAGRALDTIDAELVRGYMTAKLSERGDDRATRRKRERLSPKTVNNHLNFLHGVFAHAVKRGWATRNPVEAVERPRTHVDPDIRYLELAELEAVIRAVPDDVLGPLDAVLYLTAAMTGLRMGELAALRWRDVDWTARQVRVRRSFTRGDMGTPKSHGSNRGTPLSDRLAGELERHFQRSRWQADDDLVFAHPTTRNVYDPSKMRTRFKSALTAAGVREVRFHDLRHTFGVSMARAGAPMRMIQAWMGHANITTTEIYANFSPDPTEGASWAAKAFASKDEATVPVLA